MIDKINMPQGPSVRLGSIEIIRPSSKASAQESSNINLANSSLSNVIEDMVQQGTPIDTAHIQSIRDAIVKGGYPVDPMGVADNMIAFDDTTRDIA